jgi:hypothetical protein
MDPSRSRRADSVVLNYELFAHDHDGIFNHHAGGDRARDIGEVVRRASC